ncbi:hypothetical protein MPTK1_1g28910 [Marchantia polymorpha subsp. ruderalis]|uniref:Uncharacterized protein n=1 Tax=Marchantia polymorpha subsp. ruderalis TaxID=1480154 RepID=A0AAF6AVD5_MARPO|nr:hypothetical protein Mp_1g28910 [Marchantia polymorpha subsp. ruderalis]
MMREGGGPLNFPLLNGGIASSSPPRLEISRALCEVRNGGDRILSIDSLIVSRRAQSRKRLPVGTNVWCDSRLADDLIHHRQFVLVELLRSSHWARRCYLSTSRRSRREPARAFGG